MKGIILAGGKGTRLYPVTKAVVKSLLPVYDKPMIYYPLSVLMLAGIREILIISTPEAIPQFQALLGDGHEVGLELSYCIQTAPRGIAESFILGADFIGNDGVCLILGDNIFYGHGLPEQLQEAVEQPDGAVVFAYYVSNPRRYGVIEFDRNKTVLSIEEKPRQPKSNWIVTGLYFYDNNVVQYARECEPSGRNELEITDVNNRYLETGRLKVGLLGRGYAWLDTGTHESMIDAAMFIKTVEERQGLKIGCVEEVAYKMGFIGDEQLERLGQSMETEYGQYLLKILKEKDSAIQI